MGWQIPKRPEYIDKLEVSIDTHNPWSPPSAEALLDSEHIAVIVFYLRAFTGNDMAVFSDMTIVGGRKGKAEVRSGAVGREKVIRGVAKIEGLDDPSGTSCEEMTLRVYRELPSWITSRILRRLNKINEEIEEEEGN
jgi:hypothetical protein